MAMLSFVIPVYNSEKTVEQVVRRIGATVEAMPERCRYEIILINDGSRDAVYDVCRRLGAEMPDIVRPFCLSKNFGQSRAIMAGFHMARGDYLICMDDDLQTIPEEFPKMYDKLRREGLDVVFGYYEHKQHSRFRNFGTWLNERMQSFILGKPASLHTSTYFVVRRYVVDHIVQYDRPFPYMEGLLLLMTDHVASIPIEHAKRRYGRSGYSFGRLVELWFNGFTNFSVRPLRIASLFGGLSALGAFVMLIVFFVSRLMGAHDPAGWTSTIVIVLFIGGVQLLSVGLLGEYIGRIYLSVNRTPQFVLRPDEPSAADAGKREPAGSARSETPEAGRKAAP